MLSFFNKKPKLKELVPVNYADIHSHVLPGIDDGAKTNEDSVFLLNEMIKLGFKKVITTPHTMQNVWFNTTETITTAFTNFKKTENTLTDKVNFNAASEYYLDDYFLEIVAKKQILTIKDNYILVEMSFLNAPANLHEILFEIQLKGYVPILAHPERYLHFHNNILAYENLKKQGCLFQLNLTSTVGYYGSEIMKAADLLLKNELIDFVGSDIHHNFHVKAFEKKVAISSIENLEKAFNNNQIFL